MLVIQSESYLFITYSQDIMITIKKAVKFKANALFLGRSILWYYVCTIFMEKQKLIFSNITKVFEIQLTVSVGGGLGEVSGKGLRGGE